MSTFRTAVTSAIGAALMLLTACATPASAPAGGAASLPGTDAPRPGTANVEPSPPSGEVVGEGTVLDAGAGPSLCLGAVMESFPPQCEGIPLLGWSWEDLNDAETAAGVTWGAYAVIGTYDGSRITVTRNPMQLALYDPLPVEDPTGGEPGDIDEATLADIQEQLPPLLGAHLLESWPERGRLWTRVVWDDGTLQTTVDETYGVGVVVIVSALRSLAA
ncbi:hypothetical protein [Microbacterium sp.]|uniref:hypothetical protein n=1 Tax=Microbacterium sp. TaxID=51671 RepID=UPI003A85213D